MITVCSEMEENRCVLTPSLLVINIFLQLFFLFTAQKFAVYFTLNHGAH